MSAWLTFIGRNARFLSFGFGLNLLISVAQTFFISLFNSDFQDAVGLTHGEMSTIYGAAMLLGSFALLGSGRLLDAMDLRLFVVVNLVLAAVSAAALAAVDGVVLLFIGLFGIRFFGGSQLGLACQASMARYFDADRGKAASLSSAGHTVGFAIFPLLGALVIAALGWRGTWWAIAAAMVAFVLPLTLFQLAGQGERHRRYLDRLAAVEAKPENRDVRSLTLSEILRDRRFYMIIPGMLALPGILFTFQYHQLALIDEKQWDLTTFAAAYMLFAGTGVLASIAGGHMVDRHGSRRLLMVYVLPMIPALMIVSLVDHPVAIPLYMVGMGMTFGFGLVGNVTVWAEVFGSAHIGAIRGFTIALNTTIASITMALSGWLIDWGVSLSVQAFGAATITAVAAVLLVAVARRLPSRAQRLQSSHGGFV
jgi:MFS family permease